LDKIEAQDENYEKLYYIIYKIQQPYEVGEVDVLEKKIEHTGYIIYMYCIVLQIKRQHEGKAGEVDVLK